jgi:uncharacterized ubiquitin-like protein YukD
MKKNKISASTPEYMTPQLLEQQEHLSSDIIKLVNKENKVSDDDRPTANFIDLMNWTKQKFTCALKDTQNVNKFVHNRIIIDGQFLHFCKEKNVNVTCLHKDSIISWKTEHDYEKFFIHNYSYTFASRNIFF